MSGNSTVSFISNDTDVVWFFSSFDAGFSVIDTMKVYMGVSAPMTVSNGCYIMGIYYDHNTYQLTNTLYISDVSALSPNPIPCDAGTDPILNKDYGLKAVAAFNKKIGLFDLSKPRDFEASFALCGSIDKYVIGNDAVMLLPNQCANGYTFGRKDDVNICVGPEVVTAIANNFVSGFVGKPSLMNKYKSNLLDNAKDFVKNNIKNVANISKNTGSNASTNSYTTIIMIILFIIFACVIAFAVYAIVNKIRHT